MNQSLALVRKFVEEVYVAEQLDRERMELPVPWAVYNALGNELGASMRLADHGEVAGMLLSTSLGDVFVFPVHAGELSRLIAKRP